MSCFVSASTHGNTHSTRIATTVRSRPPVTAFASGRRNRDGSGVGRNPEAHAAMWAPHDGRWTIPMLGFSMRSSSASTAIET